MHLANRAVYDAIVASSATRFERFVGTLEHGLGPTTAPAFRALMRDKVRLHVLPGNDARFGALVDTQFRLSFLRGTWC